MDALAQPDPDIQNISLLPEHSLLEKYSNDHKTLLEITKKALCTCLEEHQPFCPTYHFGSNEFLPTRLIDLENLDRLRLVVTADTTIQDRRYVPLSHRWGTPESAEREAMTTTSENLARRLEGFGLSTLPARYIEAILICRSMNVRYMWIDSLCIIQVYIQPLKPRSRHSDVANCRGLRKTGILSVPRWGKFMKAVSSP
ncbi:hypothetical protein ACEPPN_007423 [Leptodophora sp. 'Broadleaf-Isolate-01']